MDTIPTKRLPISKIITDEQILPREKINKEHLENLVEVLEARKKLPPVDTFFDGDNYFLADGLHRYKAAKEVDRKTIEAKIHKGDKRDAILFSCGANATHGLPRNNKEKRRAVLKLLMDPKWSGWSDRSIARHCAVSQPFVTNLRHELETDNGYKFPTLRQKADGGFIETENIGKSPGDPEGQQPTDPKDRTIPVVMKADKNSLPPKDKGKRKKHNGGTEDESGQDKPNPKPEPSVIIPASN